MDGEFGIVEVGTCVALIPAISLPAWRSFKGTPVPKPIRIGYGMDAFGAFYFLSEEACWGQHWIGSTPPEAIAAGNLQQEFNLHNGVFLHDLFDEIPRTLAAVFCTGV